jgi:hypothetical protein
MASGITASSPDLKVVEVVFSRILTAIGTLIASKVLLALLAARFFSSLESRGYLLAMRLLAGTLIWFGLMSMIKAAELGFHYVGDF